MNDDLNVMLTDSYKVGHWRQYPQDTDGVYSYLEARQGARFPGTVFFGLQPILRALAGVQVTREKFEEAYDLTKVHFGSPDEFNYDGWSRIIREHDGRLPVRIKAVPEGTVLPAGNALMTVENTDPECAWLTNALESLLMHVWYPTTVASLSRYVKQMLTRKLNATSDSLDGLPFMLHDFGYRGAETHDAAAIGGAAHLVNFLGSDTLPALQLAIREYAADPASLAFSVPATEHSVMTARGRQGEFDVVADLIEQHPTGILSVVADSYDIFGFVDNLGSLFKRRIEDRDGKFVVRPDSTPPGDTPASLTVKIIRSLAADFGSTTNSKGYQVLNPKVGVLWGDGIDPAGVDEITDAIVEAGFAADTAVFGMGGGLLQKVNRDTQRMAFKASAVKVNGQWRDVYKAPLGGAKPSKKGRLRVIDVDGRILTEAEHTLRGGPPRDLLETVFENGSLVNEQTFEDIRVRAA